MGEKLRKEVVVLGIILLVVAGVLFFFPERTPESYYYERQYGGKYHVGYPEDYWHPYRGWGIIAGLIGIVTLIIGYYIPHQTTSQTVS